MVTIQTEVPAAQRYRSPDGGQLAQVGGVNPLGRLPDTGRCCRSGCVRAEDVDLWGISH